MERKKEFKIKTEKEMVSKYKTERRRQKNNHSRGKWMKSGKVCKNQRKWI